MSPVRSQDSSDSDVVMEDVDSSSSDESSDESMNDNIQMTYDTSGRGRLGSRWRRRLPRKEDEGKLGKADDKEDKKEED